MEKTRVLLVNPPGIEQYGFNNPPLSLLYLAGTLKKNRIKVGLADGFFYGWKGIEKEIKKFKPTILGVPCLSLYRRSSCRVARIAKKINPKILVVFGGVHATIMHLQMMENYSYIDVIVRGEGEQTLLKIAQGKKFNCIKGITYRNQGKIIVNPPQEYVKNIDKIPFPAWEMVNLTSYPSLPMGMTEFNGIDLRKVPRIPVIFSRGCPGHCTFCSTWTIWRGWRGRSGKNMADEIELLYKMGVRHFVFADDCMTANAKNTVDFCNEIIRRGLKIAFNVQTRTDVVNLKILQKLKQAGCYFVSYGFESGSPKILKLMDKANTVANSIQAAKLAKKAGLKIIAQMITGNFGETWQTINQSIRFLQKIQPDFVASMGGLWVYPGTKVYYWLKSKGKINDDYWLTAKPPLVYRSHFSELQIRYIKMCLEKKSLIDPSQKGWLNPLFLLFFYVEKITKKNRLAKNLLFRFSEPVNKLMQKLIG